MRELSTQFRLSHINLSKLVSLLISVLFFLTHLIVQLARYPLLSSPLIVPRHFSSKNHKQVFLSFCSCLVEHFASWSIRQLSYHHPSSQPICNSPVSALSSSLFLKKLKTDLFNFLLSLYSPGLPLDWYLWYWPSSVTSSHTHFVIIHLHFIYACFLFFEL